MSDPAPPPSYSSPQAYTTLRLAHHPASAATATPVVILSLHRPASRNAFTDTMADELVHALALLGRDRRVRVVVLAASREGKAFCAGADLKSGRGGGRLPGRPEDHRDTGGRVALAIHNLPKPVLAAIHSHAVGVGLTMTLPCALRFSTPSAKLALPFARRGIVAEACSSYFLPRLVGLSRAMHMVGTGATFSPSDEVARGLFAAVLDREEDVLPAALAAAEDMARNVSAVSWALMRDMFWRGPATPEAAHLLESRTLAGLFGGRDNEEGVRSFLEKRPPRFEGTLAEDVPEGYPWWTAGAEGKSKL